MHNILLRNYSNYTQYLPEWSCFLKGIFIIIALYITKHLYDVFKNADISLDDEVLDFNFTFCILKAVQIHHVLISYMISSKHPALKETTRKIH